MHSKLLVVIGVCALALGACKKNEADHSAAAPGEGMAREAQGGGPGMKGRPSPMRKYTKVDLLAAQMLHLQGLITVRLVKNHGDCDKAVLEASKLLDQPRWKRVLEAVHVKADAVKAAQKRLLEEDPKRASFIRGRLHFQVQCKNNEKYKAFQRRLGAVWKK